jgi:hypothetical protein
VKFLTGRFTRVVGGSVAVVGCLVFALSAPASAASPNTATGLAATGLITAGPFAQSTFPGTSPSTLVGINVPGLVTTGVVNTAATNVAAAASVNGTAITLSAIASLTADAITSSCVYDPNTNTVTGASALTGAAFTVLGIPTALAANPAPNTVVGIPGIATITLNRQTTAGDGTLTVDALAVSLIGSTQTITISTSLCNQADLAPVPMMPAPVAAGALAAFVVGGTGLQLRRRRQQREAVPAGEL